MLHESGAAARALPSPIPGVGERPAPISLQMNRSPALRARTREQAAAHQSSLPRVIAIEASVLVRVHSMLSRRKRMVILSPRKIPMRLRQRVVPVVVSSLVTVKTIAAAAPTSL